MYTVVKTLKATKTYLRTAPTQANWVKEQSMGVFCEMPSCTHTVMSSKALILLRASGHVCNIIGLDLERAIKVLLTYCVQHTQTA